MRLFRSPFLLTVLLFFVVVLPLGMLEGWYGRVDYSGDAIPYLDMARAVHAGEWRLAFNPLWGLGYPLLVVGAEKFFPVTPSGEWNAVHLLNLLIYTGCFACFMFLLRTIRKYVAHTRVAVTPLGECRVVVAGVALFLSAELCIDTVSRVGPDTLVSALVLLSLCLVRHMRFNPSWQTAATLGLVLGCGCVVKTIFVPLSLVIMLISASSLYVQRIHNGPDGYEGGKRAPYSLLAVTLAVSALLAAPYFIGLSWAFGHFTMGESGSINYAWHVNRLDLMHWQGGPAQFGTPVHPTRVLLGNPPIYGFNQPFKVSYPPFFDPPYYYEGYRHFFNLKLQLHAIAANFYHLYQSLRPLPISYAVLLSVLIIALAAPKKEALAPRKTWLREVIKLWPLYIPALAGIALYLQVHLEGRYVPAFLLVIAAGPVSVFLLRAELWPRMVTPAVLSILILGSAATLLFVDRSTITAARHHVYYADTSQWALARYLRQQGLVPGDDVAYIAGPANHCTWAHVDGLRIVAELEVSLYAPMDTGENMFWDADAQAKKTMLDTFKASGAKVVIARVTAARDYATPGWTAVPGTDDMIHDLRQ